MDFVKGGDCALAYSLLVPIEASGVVGIFLELTLVGGFGFGGVIVVVVIVIIVVVIVVYFGDFRHWALLIRGWICGGKLQQDGGLCAGRGL